jgi:hypothetical protein
VLSVLVLIILLEVPGKSTFPVVFVSVVVVVVVCLKLFASDEPKVTLVPNVFGSSPNCFKSKGAEVVSVVVCWKYLL